MNNKKFLILGIVLGVLVVLALGSAAGAAGAYTLLGEGKTLTAFAAPVAGLSDPEGGILVSYVAPDSPAAQAGIVRGDIIKSVNGEQLDDLKSFLVLLKTAAAGETFEVTVLHGDDLKSLSLTVDNQKEFPLLGLKADEFGCKTPFLKGGKMGDPGFMFKNEAFMGGVLVLEVLPDTAAEAAGLQAGDLILAVDDLTVGVKASLSDLLAKHQPGDVVTLKVTSKETGKSEVVEVTLGENPDNEGAAFLGIQYDPHGAMGWGTIEGHKMPGMPGMPGRIEIEKELELDGEFDHHFEFGDIMPLPEFGDMEGLPPHHGFLSVEEFPEGYNYAVIIGNVVAGSGAEAAGIEVGDLILGINGTLVDKGGEKALQTAVGAAKPGDQITLTLLRPGDVDAFDVTATLGEHPDAAGSAFLGVGTIGFISVDFNFKEVAPPGLLDDAPTGDA